MKNTFTIIFFVLITNLGFSQTQERILGKWVFKDAYNKEQIDEAGLVMLQMEIVNKMTFTFNQNGTFEAYIMGERQKGIWELTPDSKKILLKVPNEAVTELQILRLTSDELALKLGLGSFLMTKI